VINPNNPTGSVYPLDVLKEIVELARKNRLALFSDEIYDQILYDDAAHTSLAAIAPDLLVHTFNGMSKAYRAAGFRAGWLVLTGCGPDTADYRQGLDTLTSLPCAAIVLRPGDHPRGAPQGHEHPRTRCPGRKALRTAEHLPGAARGRFPGSAA
jgi:aspartate/methionine/tyrosine aminotransferase